MAGEHLSSVMRFIRKIAGVDEAAGTPDAQLLNRFTGQHDEDAFAALVQRHGPMVLGVCRRVLRDPHDAEDSFQATFLVFARKARSIGQPEGLGNWLYGVAYRTALKARSQGTRRRTKERQVENMPDVPCPAADAWDDFRAFLDEEVSRLPARYRAPFVLCYLEGKTNAEAARLLRCPVGTVASRMARARERLRSRLGRRGLAPSAGWLPAPAASTAVPPALASSTAKAAILVAAGQGAAAGAISANVAVLTEGVVKAMLVTKLKMAAALLLAVVVFGGAVGVAYRTLAVGAGDPNVGPPISAAEDAAKPKADSEAEQTKADRFITKVGEYKRFDGKLVVKVFEKEEGKISWSILFSDRSGPKAGYHPEGLGLHKKGSPWFIFMASPEVVWIYNGDKWMTVLEFEPNTNITPAIKATPVPLPTGWSQLLEKNPPKELLERLPPALRPPGLHLTLSADKTETEMPANVAQAKPVALKLTFTNAADKPIKLDAYDWAWSHLTVDATGPDGASLHWTAGQYGGDRTVRPPAAEDYPLIKPGYDWSPAQPLAFPGARGKFFSLVVKPGEYHIRVTYTNAKEENYDFARGSWTGSVTSNEIVLKVLAVPEPRTVRGLSAPKGDAGAEQTKSNGFITEVGDYNLFDGKLVVKVTEPAEGKIQYEVTDIPKKYRSRNGEPFFKKGSPWFIFPASRDSIWIFDGDRQIYWIGKTDVFGQMDATTGIDATLPNDWDLLLRKDPPKGVLERLPPALRPDKVGILGVWKVDSVEVGGKEASEVDSNVKIFKHSTWTVTAAKIVLKSGDKFAEYVYKLDPTVKPKTIELKSVAGSEKAFLDKTVRAVYALEGDVWKVCLSETLEQPPPSEVASKEGSTAQLLTLKRVATDKGAKRTGEADKPGPESVKGLKLTLSAETAATVMKADGSNAESVPLELTFTNTGDKPLKVDAYDWAWSRLTVEATGPDAESVHAKEVGANRTLPPPAVADYPVIKEGERWLPAVQYAFPAVLGGKSYAFLKPGEYHIRVTYTNAEEAKNAFAAGSWTGSVTSNEVVLKVLAVRKIFVPDAIGAAVIDGDNLYALTGTNDLLQINLRTTKRTTVVTFPAEFKAEMLTVADGKACVGARDAPGSREMESTRALYVVDLAAGKIAHRFTYEANPRRQAPAGHHQHTQNQL